MGLDIDALRYRFFFISSRVLVIFFYSKKPALQFVAQKKFDMVYLFFRQHIHLNHKRTVGDDE